MTTGRRVLLIDDEADLRVVLAGVLRSKGYVCAAHADAESALVEADAWDAAPDLVVTDAGLPGMDGHDLVVALEARHPGLAARTLVITGDDPGPRLTGLATDLGVRVLAKPFGMERFLAACRTVLDGPGPLR